MALNTFEYDDKEKILAAIQELATQVSNANMAIKTLEKTKNGVHIVDTTVNISVAVDPMSTVSTGAIAPLYNGEPPVACIITGVSTTDQSVSTSVVAYYYTMGYYGDPPQRTIAVSFQNTSNDTKRVSSIKCFLIYVE